MKWWQHLVVWVAGIPLLTFVGLFLFTIGSVYCQFATRALGWSPWEIISSVVILILVGIVGLPTWDAVRRCAMMTGAERRERLRLLEALDTCEDSADRLVELGGVPIARLVNPVWLEMFWDAYQIIPLTEDSFELQLLRSPKAWIDSFLFEFRCPATGLPTPGYAAGRNPFPWPGWVAMRGLHLHLAPPSSSEMIILRWRSFLSKATNP